MRRYKGQELVDPGRVNVNLGEENRVALKPFLERHHGNLSAAMRELIGFADFAVKRFGSLERAEEVLISHNRMDLKAGDRILLNLENVAAELVTHASPSGNGQVVLNINGIIKSEASKA